MQAKKKPTVQPKGDYNCAAKGEDKYNANQVQQTISNLTADDLSLLSELPPELLLLNPNSEDEMAVTHVKQSKEFLDFISDFDSPRVSPKSLEELEE
ncbi:hypothetical protein ACH5RR_009085 [Cinchona calisaya]|uniref:Uncharacterized protein n=1 Tax=Cinchona calisaya TaxID=153742 RepID=A0ABD3AF38_9GENT